MEIHVFCTRLAYNKANTKFDSVHCKTFSAYYVLMKTHSNFNFEVFLTAFF